MSKCSFKHKLSRVLPSLQLCRSKYPSTSVETPTSRRSAHWLSPVNPKAIDIGYPNLPGPPPCTPEPQPSIIRRRHRHVSGKMEESETGRIRRKKEVGGVMRDSVAVVKRSSEPYEDFKRSMVEVILEKQLFDRRELEEMLRCFLSLNATPYHGVIVEAFTDIWEVLAADWPVENSTDRSM